MSLIWAPSTRGSPLEYGPRIGKKADAMSKGGACPACAQWTYWPSWRALEYQG
jgi:hypothetical protein